MSGHTPGPWRLLVSHSDRGAFALHGDSPEPHGDNMVIAQRNIGTPNGDEGIANARLIAAAPDLYAVLKELPCEAEEWGHFCRQCEEAGNTCRKADALAKAEGITG